MKVIYMQIYGFKFQTNDLVLIFFISYYLLIHYKKHFNYKFLKDILKSNYITVALFLRIESVQFASILLKNFLK